MRFHRSIAGSLMVCSALCSAAYTPAGAKAGEDGGAQKATPTTPASDIPTKGMAYRMIGPFRGGRATGVTGIPQDPTTYYQGTAGGGVWKTTDAGTTWKPMWDDLPEASPSVAAVVVSPANPDIVYAGTGEGAIRGNVIAGNGVYKSMDAGKTWAYVGLKDTHYIGKMAISDTDPDTVFVAAIGSIYSEGTQERGIYRTRDGGKSWQKVLFVDEDTGAVDVAIDPSDPNTIYAGMWEVYRRPWTLESGGPGSGIYRSRDGGDTWEKLEGGGLPEGIMGRIGIAPSPDPKRIYALIEAEDGGLFRSNDGGANWERINADGKFRQRAWYYTNVFADPKDPETVYVLNTGAYKSGDGGKTFKKMPTFHGDNHQLWINPKDTRYLVDGNDGGAGISVNGGETWTEQMNQATAQIYHISTDNQVPYKVYGAQQDNTTIAALSRGIAGPYGKLGTSTWNPVGGGESGYVVADPQNPDIVYAGSYGGTVTRYDQRTGQAVPINPWPRETMGWAPKDLKHRAQWTEPLAFSPHEPDTLYYANEVLFKTTDQGRSWTIISPDLTRNDKSKQISSGGPLTKDNTGVEVYGTIFSVAESPVQAGLIWAGTDDGLVQLTRDGGTSWTNVTPKAMPEWCAVKGMEPHATRAGTAYIAVDCHRVNDLAPYAFKTTDYGQTWTSITSGIAEDAYVHVVRADEKREGLLYAGTENGIYFSFDEGDSWRPLQLNLPRTPVHDLALQANDLAVATHGRSFWILDDLSPLQQWEPGIARSPAHFFAPRETVRLLAPGRGDSTSKFVGTNPPTGVILYYWLGKSVAQEDIKLEILDSAQRVVRTFDGIVPEKKEDGDDYYGKGNPDVLPTAAGLNRFAWDMNYKGPVEVPDSALWGAPTSGPTALPGTYTARLTVKGKSFTQPIVLLPNPNASASAEDLKAQFDLAVAAYDDLNTIQSAILEVRQVQAAVASRQEQLADRPDAEAARMLADLDGKLAGVEDLMIQKRAIAPQDPLAFPVGLNNQIASLARRVGSLEVAPTAQQRVEYSDLKAMLTSAMAAWDEVKTQDIPKVNAALGGLEVKPISLTFSRPSDYFRYAL